MGEFEHNEVSDAQNKADQSYNHPKEDEKDFHHKIAKDPEWEKLGLQAKVKPSQGF